ncbi:CRISPR system precrRNA processing endoribonuclease RAMP protein Cas6 [Salinarchaeum sp. IM2453]|uniref:CRISPR system precrRNA processing endoribonuclease RAMP protein Cas6 n=1 Tax=Salinarchaeum sp. IM2453 TaxID=2862870 RepID=UPI001C83DB80|nr:CRISPR system precrRNA processing endoribonuclease RAMP protein Cas6 [Salinarchaeum sp. IM2453]QZA89521.1 CRISPR system precrRNA processing endoribonuclease RAMP protein Cas6 [Salinarchaeum sp. IM2453]
MHRLTLTLRPKNGTFPVPFSTGPQVYSGLLSVLDAVDEELAQTIHDDPFSSLVNSGLQGHFDPHGVEHDYHQLLLDKPYRLHLGITHPSDDELFEALVRAFVIEDRCLPLAHGELSVESVQSDSTTPNELLNHASELVDGGAAGVRFQFISPTCYQRYGNVWDVYPDRTELFPHLADRWNAMVTSEDLEITPTAEAVGRELYTDVDTGAYDIHSVVVHRWKRNSAESEGQTAATDGGEPSNAKQCQGFVGSWSYRFKQASTATKHAVVLLGLFAEYAGVGRHNARGAGTVQTDIIGVDGS